MSHRSRLSPTPDPDRHGSFSGPVASDSSGTYPLPAYLNFSPGGVRYNRPTTNSNPSSHAGRSFSSRASASPRNRGGRSTSSSDPSGHFVNLSQYSTQPQQSPASSSPSTGPEAIVHRALRADTTLRKYALLHARRDWEQSSVENNGEDNEEGGDNESIEMEDAASPNKNSFEDEQGNFDPKKVPHYLPSLSVLAEKAFGPLTGVPANSARWWADTMVLSYLDDEDVDINEVETKQDVSMREHQWETPRKKVAAANPNRKADLVSTLKHLHEVAEKSSPMSPHLARTGRPCGYVFRRGDIAWNCRTCQTDNTCVLCDRCFHESDHEGHEVFFHRTSPGGCCDCGDLEAWKVEGCCERHRPRKVADSPTCLPVTDAGAVGGEGDDFEAVRAALRGRADGEEAVRTLPPRFAAALGVVIGNAVQAAVRALDGSGIGADPCQWRLRWADQVCRIRHGAADNEDYFLCMPTSEEGGLVPRESEEMTPQSLLEASDASARSPSSSSSMSPHASSSSNGLDATMSTGLISPSRPPDPPAMPSRFRLQLRLHNDDVHTFDEVIEALHDQSYIRRHHPVPGSETETSAGLVMNRESADDMTHHVDSDGQVTVRSYETFAGAKAGYERLKGRGLHCAVISTPQVDLELRVKCLLSWLADIGAAHPGAAALVVHALVDVTEGEDIFGEVNVWDGARMIPSWCGSALDFDGEGGEDELLSKRFGAFPPHLESSYLTREESERLFRIAFESGSYDSKDFAILTGADPTFYSNVPYSLPSERYRKSPHALWGTMPMNNQMSQPSPHLAHPILARLKSRHGTPAVNDKSYKKSCLRETMLLIDTDLRKQQEADRLTGSMFPHQLSGLHLISGIGLVPGSGGGSGGSSTAGKRPSPDEWRHLLATSSFRAPVSPINLMLLLDPYPSKQLRSAVHKLFLSLLVDSRFKSRFAASLGGVVYRPISTLFCAGVGTDSDTPLGFTVQIFTAGSLVRALGNAEATKRLLTCDAGNGDGDNIDATGTGSDAANSIDVFTIPIAHTVVRCIHSNLLGATKEVTMVLKNTAGSDENGGNSSTGLSRNDAVLPSLTYQPGEHPLTLPLPAAPDDGFLDSRSTKHRRLPHLLRDLEYIFETPGTAMRLLLPPSSPMRATNIPQSIVESYGPQSLLTFPTIWSRLLRLAQGMDPQKRKTSGGHIEFEQQRWLEAFGLSINIAGTRDALAESASNFAPNSSILPSLGPMREAVGNLFMALLREIKLWLYREGLLETGLPMPASSGAPGGELGQQEALQRSTLHVSSSQTAASLPSSTADGNAVVAHSCQLSCATGIKMTEAQLALIESALRHELLQHGGRGTIMGDRLRVPHKPLEGESISFHLPLHRALARSIRSICSVVVPDEYRASNPGSWWKLPVLDDDVPAFPKGASADPGSMILQHPLCALLRPTLRSSNCRVVWSAGLECSTPEAQLRRSRSRAVSAAIASAKIVHSLCDHPLRCLAASQQIERHLWARNGSSATGMALNYGSAPLCRSFRDLDLTLVQLSASGLSIGLGAGRVFSLLLSRFSMDGYLVDPRRVSGLGTGGGASGSSSPTSGNAYGGGSSGWVNPPRLNDPDYAVPLSESFFTTLCLVVTELPSPPPLSGFDDSALRQNMRRELLHALAAKPRSHSEAMAAASGAATRRDESDGSSGGSSGASSFYSVFVDVLKDIGRQKNQGSKTGPPTYELKPSCSDEYDPTFFHLRRTEHQHAMDNIARLRRLKLSPGGKDSKKCLPLVSPPPLAHPRFMPCRLLLHLSPMDAAIRRMLLFALTDGQWLPPSEPEPEEPTTEGIEGAYAETTGAMTSSGTPVQISLQAKLGRRTPNRSAKRSTSPMAPKPFSPAVVAASSKSFLEVLQVLTLQVHTLEECASLHRTQPCLDEESKSLSASLSINTYLGRLINVPGSLVDIWSLRCYPDGPLPSKGSGANRGSILGLLIALYEHRSDHGNSSGGVADSGHGDDGHGGARALAADGLKWLLRFVNALVDGASSVSAACQSATNGIPVQGSGKIGIGAASTTSSGVSAPWTINPTVRDGIRDMLRDLPDLWPKEEDSSASSGASGAAEMSKKNQAARKAAQQRALERMKKQQASFAASIASLESKNGSAAGEKNKGIDDDPYDEVADLCIICRCDDADGENNGPLGYLGHVQRSRTLQLRSMAEIGTRESVDAQNELHQTYRVVGDRGCQLRATEAMDSAPVACLPMGSVVTVLRSKVLPKYDLLSRRVLVRHIKSKSTSENKNEDAKITEGWASVQSSQGYVILSPLSSLCYTNSRWGSTRPIIRQCGHAAHLRCVETHCLSLHQRAAGEQPYDGRFAANIDDGEFLCPLCKQLSNVLVPKDGFQESEKTISRMSSQISVDSSSARSSLSGEDAIKGDTSASDTGKNDHAAPSKSTCSMSSLRMILSTPSSAEYTNTRMEIEKERKATKEFGNNLLQAMQIPWDRTTAAKMKQQKAWHPALRRWNFEEEDGDDILPGLNSSEPVIGNVLRLFRQQHIAWAAVGHTTAAAEASSRTILQFGDYVTSDPWTDYRRDSRDSHPMLLELRRTVAATSSHLRVLSFELGRQLGTEEAKSKGENTAIIGRLLGDILNGSFWSSRSASKFSRDCLEEWRVITALISAMPCHVSRDGMLAQRHEARATAAAMWAVKGIGYSPKQKSSLAQTARPEESPGPKTESDVLLPPSSLGINDSQKEGDSADQLLSCETILPPTPYCIKEVSTASIDWSSTDTSEACDLKSPWGSMDPFMESQSDPVPFRPAVASAFLYVPLLAWDMNTLAGAVFSSLLSNCDASSSVGSEDLLFASQTLLIGRLVQVLITPDGFDPLSSTTSEDSYEDEDEKLWSEEELSQERISLNSLLFYCRKLVNYRSESAKDLDTNTDLMKAVGYAILPFARTLILLLRVCSSILRQKQRRERSKKGDKPSLIDKQLDSLALDEDIMTYEDGFKILHSLGGPMPSKLITATSSFPWNALISRWIASLNSFEAYHGSHGNGLVFDPISGTWVSGSDNNSSGINGSPTVINKKDGVVGEAHEVTYDSGKIDSSDRIAGEQGIIDGPLGSNDASIDMQDADDSTVDDNNDAFSNGDYEEMEEDESSEIEGLSADGEALEINMNVRLLNRHGEILDDVDVGSDDDLEEMEMDADGAEETIDLDEALGEGFGASRHAVDAEAQADIDDASDSSSTDYASSSVDRDYADVSRSGIVPYQPSLLGGKRIAPGPRGASFDYGRGSDVMSDLSHLGMVHRPDSPAIGLIRLPRSFVELYSLVNRVKGRDQTGAMDENDDGSSSETAICLLTGTIMRSGSSRRTYSRSSRPPGACTLHARKIGSGVGIFFLVQKCTVLLMHNNKSAYSPSLYVDAHGEEDPGLRRGRPLFLKSERFQSLEMLWRQHGIPREVAQIRSTSDRVIRDNWY